MPPRRTRSLSVSLTPEQAIHVIRAVFERMHVRAVDTDMANYVAVAKTAMSVWSLGEDIVARVTPRGHGCLVEVSSQSSWSTTLVDWGKNSENLDVFERTLQELAGAQIQQLSQERKLQEERAQAEQRAVYTALVKIVADSKSIASELAGLARAAERSLDSAEYEFGEGAFAPFWDAIERAAFNLASFNQHISLLDEKALSYRAALGRLEASPPSFDLGLQSFPDVTPTIERMRALVRRAEKDFHFATIYEQRKTNRLLVRGFSTLGQALGELQDRLDSSLEALTVSIRGAISDVTVAQTDAASTLLRQLEAMKTQTDQESEARRHHERKERDLLNKILDSTRRKESR